MKGTGHGISSSKARVTEYPVQRDGSQNIQFKGTGHRISSSKGRVTEYPVQRDGSRNIQFKGTGHGIYSLKGRVTEYPVQRDGSRNIQFKGTGHGKKQDKFLKELMLNLSNPPCKDGLADFKTVSLKPSSYQ